MIATRRFSVGERVHWVRAVRHEVDGGWFNTYTAVTVVRLSTKRVSIRLDDGALRHVLPCSLTPLRQAVAKDSASKGAPDHPNVGGVETLKEHG
jgi:hypothetical protein